MTVLGLLADVDIGHISKESLSGSNFGEISERSIFEGGQLTMCQMAPSAQGGFGLHCGNFFAPPPASRSHSWRDAKIAQNVKSPFISCNPILHQAPGVPNTCTNHEKVSMHTDLNSSQLIISF